MQLIGHIQSERAARALSDYLVTQHIRHDVNAVTANENSAATHFQFFVAEENVEQAQPLFDEFVANPNQKKYLEASWQAGVTQGVNKQNLGLKQMWQGAGRLTQLVTLVCAGLFIAALFGFAPSYYQALRFGFEPTEPYRLLTPIFMHGSVLHILFNLAWWWFLGGKIEKTLGWPALLSIMVISGLVSNIAQAVLVSGHFVGLSGVVYALAGFTWFCGRYRGSNTLFLPNNVFGFLLAWMALGFFDVLPVNMANWAHLGGLLAGLSLAHFMIKPRTNDRTNSLD